MKYDNELLMPIELWIDALDMRTTWDVITGAGWGWGWIHPDYPADSEIPDSHRFRFDFEFEKDTPVDIMLETVKAALRIDVPEMFPVSPNLVIAKAFLYAEHAHPSTDIFKREQKMDEITVFLRFTNIDESELPVE